MISSSSAVACGSRPGGRLVEDRDLRVLHQDFGKAEPLAHAAREGLDPLVGDVRQSDMRRASALIFSSRSAAVEPDQARGVAQIVGRGEIVVEADLVGQIADAALHLQRLAHRVVAEHAGLSAGDVAQAEQHQDRRGLAGAVRTEQAENLAARHGERDAFDDGVPS